VDVDEADICPGCCKNLNHCITNAAEPAAARWSSRRDGWLIGNRLLSEVGQARKVICERLV
jgi:hypothetical protein